MGARGYDRYGLTRNEPPPRLRFPSAFSQLKWQIQHDSDYAWTWQHDLAAASIDEGRTHFQANRAAARFMKSCFDVDVTKFPQWAGLNLPVEVSIDDRTPNVKRESLPPAERELTLYAYDSPARPGNTPQPSDQDWTLKIPLDDGTRLNLHMGRASHANFTAMLAAEAVDDAEDQL